MLFYWLVIGQVENGETAEGSRHLVDEFHDSTGAAHHQLINIVRRLAR
jgi:hypothetical protein